MGLEALRRDLGITGIEALRRDLGVDPPDVGQKKSPSALANLRNLPKLLTEGIPAAGRAAWARATDPTPTMGQELARAAPWLPIVPAVQDIVSRAGRMLSAPGAAVAELGPERAKPLTEALANVAMGGRGARRAFAGAPTPEMPPPAPSLPRPARTEPPVAPSAPPTPPAATAAPPSGRPSAPMDVFGLEMDKSRAPMPPPAPAITPSPEIALRDYAAPGGTKVVQQIGDEVVTWTKTDRNEWQGWVAGAHRKLSGESALNLAAHPPAKVVGAGAPVPQPAVANVQRPVAPSPPPDVLDESMARLREVFGPPETPMGPPKSLDEHLADTHNALREMSEGLGRLDAQIERGHQAVDKWEQSIFRRKSARAKRVGPSFQPPVNPRALPVKPPDVGPAPRFEATPEGMQGVIGGTPAPTMPQRALKAPVPQQAETSSPLFGQERAARSEATAATQTRLEMGGRQQANVNEWVMDQIGGTYGIALTRAKSPEAIQPAVVAKLKSLGIDPVDAWHATHAEVPPAGVLDRLAQLSVPKPALGPKPDVAPGRPPKPNVEGKVAWIESRLRAGEINADQRALLEDELASLKTGRPLGRVDDVLPPKPPDVGPKRARVQKRGLWEETGSPDLNDPEHMAALVQGYGKLRPTPDRAGEMRDIPSYFKKKDGLAPQQMAQAILEDYPHLLGGDVKAVEDQMLDVMTRYVSLRRDKATKKAKEKAAYDVESSVTGKRVSGKLAPEDTALKQEMDWWTKLMLLLGTGTGARLGWPRPSEGT